MNGVNLCRAFEIYKLSEKTDVWYSAFHGPAVGVQFQLLHSPVVVSSFQTLDSRYNRLAQSLHAKQLSFAAGSLIPAFNMSGLMMTW